MSGICGLFRLDGAPVTEHDLRAMLAMLEARGPQRTGYWQQGPLGLGHTLLATTPELQFERLPFVHAESGCAITADVRLDNREELLAALDLPALSESTGDAELILHAYLKWNEQCPDCLLGDFAFSIWDSRRQELFCARDHFGMRPLYFNHAPGKRFVFASAPRAILALSQVPYSIDEGRIADFLVPELEWIDFTSTFFEGVFRLPPGHKATVTREAIRTEEYWRPQPGPDLGPMSDEKYRDGFLEVFTAAIDSRLRAPPRTLGSMLSGGMDSGSVAAIAGEILASRGDAPLSTYSALRPRDADCTESRAIHAAIRMLTLAPVLIYPDSIAKDAETLVSANEEPFDGEMMLLKGIYRAAQQQGRTTLLDGAGGDIVLNEGSHIARLMRTGHFGQALHEINGQKEFWGDALGRSLVYRCLRAAFVPRLIKRPLRTIRDRYRVRGYVEKSLISADFASRIDIESRFARMRETFPSRLHPDYGIERCDSIRPNVTAGRERYARMAAASGIEARDPFLDKRVVAYCSRLPGRLLMRDGWPKMILREAMADRLPDDVRWCRGKPHLGEVFNAAVTRAARETGLLNIGGLQSALKDRVDATALDRAWQVFVHGGDAEPVHTAFVLSEWLRENVNRPVVPDQQFR